MYLDDCEKEELEETVAAFYGARLLQLMQRATLQFPRLIVWSGLVSVTLVIVAHRWQENLPEKTMLVAGALAFGICLGAYRVSKQLGHIIWTSMPNTDEMQKIVNEVSEVYATTKIHDAVCDLCAAIRCGDTSTVRSCLTELQQWPHVCKLIFIRDVMNTYSSIPLDQTTETPPW